MLLIKALEFALTDFISIESKHEVTILSGLNEFVVKFYGPQGSKSVFKLFTYMDFMEKKKNSTFHLKIKRKKPVLKD